MSQNCRRKALFLRPFRRTVFRSGWANCTRRSSPGVRPLETISLRYFNVFGPRQTLESKYAAVIPLFIRGLVEGRRPVIFGDGAQTRDFTFIDNIVEANLRAAQLSLASGTILNIATGTRISLNELANLLNEIFGSQIELVYEPERLG